MRNISDESCREILNTIYIQYLSFQNRAVYEIMWQNTAGRGRQQVTIWRRRIAHSIPKATHTLTIRNV